MRAFDGNIMRLTIVIPGRLPGQGPWPSDSDGLWSTDRSRHRGRRASWQRWTRRGRVLARIGAVQRTSCGTWLGWTVPSVTWDTAWSSQSTCLRASPKSRN